MAWMTWRGPYWNGVETRRKRPVRTWAGLYRHHNRRWQKALSRLAENQRDAALTMRGRSQEMRNAVTSRRKPPIMGAGGDADGRRRPAPHSRPVRTPPSAF
jgi:hypothetical protein